MLDNNNECLRQTQVNVEKQKQCGRFVAYYSKFLNLAVHDEDCPGKWLFVNPIPDTMPMTKNYSCCQPATSL